jgi:peptide/nickel transport system substrate-binding protein
MAEKRYHPHYTDSHALLIGIDEYQSFAPLTTAIKGVRELARLLQSEFEFRPENVIALENEQATQRNIRRRLTDPLARAEKVGPDDRVLIYFAGHGVTVDTAVGEVGYIVPVDGERGYEDTLISMDDLTKTAAERIHAKHVLFLLDACFSGFATTRLAESVQRQLNDYLTLPARQVITAGTREQVVSDYWGPGGHSLFTGFLLEGLRGAAPMPGGVLRGFHLAGHLQDQVAQHSRSLQTPQYAALMGSRGGDFIFSVRDIVELPQWLSATIESADPTQRMIAVSHLLGIAQGDDRRLADMALTHLMALAEDDNPLVRSSASTALQQVAPPPVTPPAEEVVAAPDADRPPPSETIPRPAEVKPAPSAAEVKPAPTPRPARPPEQVRDREAAPSASRRSFLKLAGIGGAAAAAALGIGYGVISSQKDRRPTPSPEPEEEPEAGGAVASARYGGTLNVGTRVRTVGHPASMSWIDVANAVHLVNERLTFIDRDNVARPWLLESWEANNSVDEWTLILRQGVRFNDGSELTADDVIFTFRQWFDEDVGSNMYGLMDYLDPGNIEKVDDYTIRLYLDSPQIGVPEHLSHYPAVIVPSTFDGDWERQPVGTGPFLLEEYIEGESAVFVRRDDYWRTGENGDQLPYLDRVVMLDVGDEYEARIAALQSGQVDTVFNPSAEVWQAAKDDPYINVYSTPSAATFVIRMRVDTTPFSDNRVRQALKKCVDRQQALDLAWYGEGVLGHDTHIAPVHPAYCMMEDIPAYDPEGAKALLAEAGYPDGLEVDLYAQDAHAESILAEVLAESALAAGFKISLNILTAAEYWDIWKEVDLGITPWPHRSPGTEILKPAYSADEGGNPSIWNETGWVDDEFIALLRQAEQTLDVDARRELFCQMEDIQQERGSVCIPFFTNTWAVCHKRFKNVRAHPLDYAFFDDVYIEEGA